MTNVFIDGQAGTTGLELASRLAKRKDLTILRIPEDSRKICLRAQQFIRRQTLSYSAARSGRSRGG